MGSGNLLLSDDMWIRVPLQNKIIVKNIVVPNPSSDLRCRSGVETTSHVPLYEYDSPSLRGDFTVLGPRPLPSLTVS